MARAMVNAQQTLPQGQVLKLYKNNSDGKGNSYGAHENYLLERGTPFGVGDPPPDALLRHPPDLHRRRQGRLRERTPGHALSDHPTGRLLRGDVGLETTLKRPIINTRDEPHGDPGKYRRLHVIIGDANLSEVQTFLKLGVTALFLAALEDDAFPETLDLADPVEACWRVSHDLDLTRPSSWKTVRPPPRCRCSSDTWSG
jgi:Pup amidohydrolase